MQESFRRKYGNPEKAAGSDVNIHRRWRRIPARRALTARGRARIFCATETIGRISHVICLRVGEVGGLAARDQYVGEEAILDSAARRSEVVRFVHVHQEALDRNGADRLAEEHFLDGGAAYRLQGRKHQQKFAEAERLSRI